MRSAVILAGGKSTRMAFDKCTTLFRGKPLLFWSYNALRRVAEDMILSISGDRDEGPLREFLGNRVRFIRDEKTGQGPLYGMFMSFREARGEYVAVAPCDAPFIKPELYVKMFRIAEGADAAVPEVDGYLEPLHAVYRRGAMLKAIETVLAEGGKRPKDTYKFLSINKLTQDEIKEVDPDLLSFVNINTLQTLESVSDLDSLER